MVEFTNSSTFESFLQTCTVALPDGSSDPRPIVMLRDTGSAQSIILESMLPFSSKSYTGNNVLICGIFGLYFSATAHYPFKIRPYFWSCEYRCAHTITCGGRRDDPR